MKINAARQFIFKNARSISLATFMFCYIERTMFYEDIIRDGIKYVEDNTDAITAAHSMSNFTYHIMPYRYKK